MADSGFLAELMRSTADGAYVVDEHQRIVAWNQAAEDLLGFTAKDVLGQPCHQIIGGRADGGCVICRRGCQPFVAGLRGELVPSFDVQVRTVHGRSRWVNAGVIAITVANEQGASAPAFIHLLRDMEAKKQAESFAVEVATLARRISLKSPISTAQQDLPIPALTAREQDVLVLLAEGADTAAIATQLLIGSSTVRNHVQRILHKLGVHSRLEAVACAREYGILDS
jgi:DNA-binding CsgD family transcriptional regulator